MAPSSRPFVAVVAFSLVLPFQVPATATDELLLLILPLVVQAYCGEEGAAANASAWAAAFLLMISAQEAVSAAFPFAWPERPG